MSVWCVVQRVCVSVCVCGAERCVGWRLCHWNVGSLRPHSTGSQRNPRWVALRLLHRYLFIVAQQEVEGSTGEAGKASGPPAPTAGQCHHDDLLGSCHVSWLCWWFRLAVLVAKSTIIVLLNCHFLWVQKLCWGDYVITYFTKCFTMWFFLLCFTDIFNKLLLSHGTIQHFCAESVVKCQPTNPVADHKLRQFFTWPLQQFQLLDISNSLLSELACFILCH